MDITEDKLRGLLPKNTSVAITSEILTLVNNMGEDVDLPQDMLQEDLMSYMYLLGNSTNGVKELVNAIKFCNLKRNYSNKQSWGIVFPDSKERLERLGKNVDNHVSAYNKSKLVLAIDKDMLIPAHLQYSSYHHKAINELYKVGVLNDGGLSADGDRMTVTPMVKVQALKELAALTKQPEETKIDLKVSNSSEMITMQEEMNQQLKLIVDSQSKRLESGENIIDVQEIGVNFDSIGTIDE